MRNTQDCRSRGLVAPPRFDPDEPIFNDIDSPNTMFSAKRIKSEEDLDGVGDRFVLLGQKCDFDRQTSLEFD